MNKSSRYIRPLLLERKNIGGKARGLQFLMEHDLLVPDAYLLRAEAFQDWRNGEDVFSVIREELTSIIGNKKYIVRSSAELEDSSKFSFAGQYKTVPSVEGIAAVLKGIKDVWYSALDDKVLSYSRKKGLDIELSLAVIIQEMIDPEYSGVVFTKNPVNGVEMVLVEGIKGSSDKILQNGLDPERWIYRWGEFIEHPVNSSLDFEKISRIVETSKSIEKKYGAAVDLEWVYSNGKIWWIQLREITTIDKKNFYSNKLSRQHLPGLIKPLVWSINIPLVCGAWIRLLDEMIGDVDLNPEEMAKQFYFRAYYNMSALGREFEKLGIPRDSLEVLNQGTTQGSIRPKPPISLLPRLFKFVFGKLFFENRLAKHYEMSDKKIKELEKREAKTPEEALKYIEELFEYNEDAAYYVIVSQMLHQVFYRILLNRVTKKGKNIEDIYVERLIIEINPYYNLKKLSCYLHETGKFQSLDDVLSYEHSSEILNDFMDRFGHLRDSGNDFSQPTWRERPELVYQMLKDFNHNHIREEFTRSRGWLAKKVSKQFELREIISFNYIKSYGLFRKHFIKIGTWLKDICLINHESDVFYLSYNELKDIIQNGCEENLISKIEQIKLRMKQAETVEVPTEIYGETPPILTNINLQFKEIKGIPASNGYYKGIIRHVKSLNNFTSVKKGDIVVIPYSDISWLPILSKAGAIISESGGVLSHAAVIAREYKIPSVLGVKAAFKIPDGSVAYLDGYLGIIKILED